MEKEMNRLSFMFFVITFGVFTSTGYALEIKSKASDGSSYTFRCDDGGVANVVVTSNSYQPYYASGKQFGNLNDAAIYSCSKQSVQTESKYSNKPTKDLSSSIKIDELLEFIVNSMNSGLKIPDIAGYTNKNGFGVGSISGSVDGFELSGSLPFNQDSGYIQISKRTRFRANDVNSTFDFFKKHFRRVNATEIIVDNQQESVERNSSCSHTTYNLREEKKKINGYTITIRKLGGVLSKCGGSRDKAQGFIYIQVSK